jgi:hypothetical protein
MCVCQLVDIPLTAWQFLLRLKDAQAIPASRERQGVPTNSELRRWLDSGAVLINNMALSPVDGVEFPVVQCVFFPQSRHGRVTMQ